MTIGIGDVVHIDQIFRVDGVNCVVGADYELEDAGTATTDIELLNALMNDNWTPTFIDGVWQAANSTGVMATCARVQKILPNQETDFIYVQNIAGGVITDWLPSQFAAMITKTGKTSGPGSSGRSNFPSPPEAHFTSGRLNAAGNALWGPVASFLNDILTLGADNTQWAPQHVQKAGVHSDVFRTWTNPNIRTIRSRQAIACPV